MQPRLLQPRTGDRWVCPSERQALGQNVGVNKTDKQIIDAFVYMCCLTLLCFLLAGFFLTAPYSYSILLLL